MRNYLDRIKDPVLREEARLFIYQEAMHSKEHARCNEVLRKVHPYGGEMEKFQAVLLGMHRRFAPKASQLAVTCALEHFTAMFADALLTRQDGVRAHCDPAFADLWLWHAVEETEHKAVCFDVYRHVVGKGPFAWFLRVSTMAFVSLICGTGLAAGFAIIKWKQRKAKRVGDPGPRGPSVRALMRSAQLRQYLDYYRPSFHPWNHENRHLIDRWKEVYGDFGLKDAAERVVEEGVAVTDEAKQPG